MKKVGWALLGLIFVLTGSLQAADRGRIAVAAEGKTPAARVSGVAARSPYFLIFDGEGKFLEAVENPFKTAKGGAGTSVVPFLAQKGAGMIVAGEFGKNMIQAMEGKGMSYLEYRGGVEEALQKALEKKK